MRGEEVVQDSLTADELAVDHHGEADVQDDVVVDGQTKEESDELILLLALKRGRVE